MREFLSPREKALKERQRRTFSVKSGQLFWERNGIDGKSSGEHGSTVVIIDEFSTVQNDTGFKEKTFLVLVTESDGRLYVRQGHRFLTEFNDGCTERLSW